MASGAAFLYPTCGKCDTFLGWTLIRIVKFSAWQISNSPCLKIIWRCECPRRASTSIHLARLPAYSLTTRSRDPKFSRSPKYIPTTTLERLGASSANTDTTASFSCGLTPIALRIGYCHLLHHRWLFKSTVFPNPAYSDDHTIVPPSNLRSDKDPGLLLKDNRSRIC